MRFLVGMIAVLAACRLHFDDAPGLLVVTTTEDRLAGGPTIASLDDLPAGTVGLSLREAVTIAANDSTDDHILFDAAVFGPGTISLGSPLHITGDDTIIDGRGAQVTLTSANANEDLIVIEANHVTLSTLTFANAGHNAIMLQGTTGTTIEDSTIDRPIGDAVSAQDDIDLAVVRTKITLATKDQNIGIHLVGTRGAHVTDCVIDPNLSHLIELDDAADSEISGNVLDGGGAGLAIFGTSPRTLVARNAFLNSSEPLYVESNATETRIINNTFWMTGNFVDNAGSQQANNLIDPADGELVDPAGYIFRLAPGSAAIDQGTDTGLDLLPDRPERFLGAAPDLGCAESY